MMSVLNPRPGYAYAIVNKGDPHTYSKYRQKRYRLVRWDFTPKAEGKPFDKEGFMISEFGDRIPRNPYIGAALLGEEQNGDVVHAAGNVLMEITAEEFQRQQEEGTPHVDGTEGQRGADAMEARLIKKRTFLDPMRGIRSIKVGYDRLDSRGHGQLEVEEEGDL